MPWKAYAFRAPEELIQRVDGTLTKFVHTRKEAPLDRSEFIRRAIERDLAHLERGAKQRQRGQKRGRRNTHTGQKRKIAGIDGAQRGQG